MPTTRALLASAIVIAILLLVLIVFILTSQSPPPITVRHIKSVQSGNFVTATFDITNHATGRYFVYPFSVEVRNGPVWKICFGSSSPILGPHGFETFDLGPYGSQTATYYMTNLPTGSPLRLRMELNKESSGLEAVFLRFKFWRLNAFRPGNRHRPVFSKPFQIVSDEFVEPEPNQ